MQVARVLFVFCTLIAVLYLMGTAVWMIAAVLGIAELGSLAYISVAGILAITGFFAGAPWVLRKALNWRGQMRNESELSCSR